MLYEFDATKCKCKSMGIVLKRRDNAPIVKDVYGGIIDILMKDKNIDKSIDFLHKQLTQLVEKKVPDEKLIISKSLRSFYKNPKQIAHGVVVFIAIQAPHGRPSRLAREVAFFQMRHHPLDLPHHQRTLLGRG